MTAFNDLIIGFTNAQRNLNKHVGGFESGYDTILKRVKENREKLKNANNKNKDKLTAVIRGDLKVLQHILKTYTLIKHVVRNRQSNNNLQNYYRSKRL